jgi:uncharacterized protein with von Willebrand factor type A (vWA) domain
MFIDFFFFLRDHGIHVSIGEWLVLLEGMKKGLHRNTLHGFYILCRSIAVRNESEYDLFDVAFDEYFHDLPPQSVLPKELQQLNQIDSIEIEKELRDQNNMMEIDNRANEDTNISSAGLQMPGGASTGGRSSIRGKRKFRDFRKDNHLDTRQFQMAFRLLRNLSTQNDTSELEFDIDQTIKSTCDMGGMLKVEYRKPRRNNIRVLLFIDSGGSMSGYARLCSELFQAATASRHLKELQTFYFHNCIYSAVDKEPTLSMKKGVSLDQLIAQCNEKYRVIIVGDAEMHPYELSGSEYDWVADKAGEPGITCLKKIKLHFPHTIWLNPTPMPTIHDAWTDTHFEIADIIDMYDLTLQGLEDGFKFLLSGRK